MPRWVIVCLAFFATVAPFSMVRSDDVKPPAAGSLYPGFSGYTRKVTTNSAEAQRWFDQGIQLLYGFNHDEAIRSFERAARIDPSCAMAWWGAAYARGIHINNPEMGAEQSRRAHEAARKAVAALDDESPVEQWLVRAVSRRYAWPAPEDRATLDRQYAAAMEAVWHAHPDDPDCGALFAESLMNLQPWDLWTTDGAPKGRALEIVAVLERTLEKHPRHPGANHFYIHAIEASPWPERGLAAAERLVDLVPGSGHLVHMPSHIFIRLGRYAEAADLNQRAIQVDEKYFALAPPPDFYSIYFIHDIHFLAYAAMMEGRSAAASAAARKLERSVPPEFLREHAPIADGFMPTTLHVLIRFGEWDDILAEPEPAEWRLLSRIERHFARSLAFSALGQTKQSRSEIERLAAVAEELTDEWKMGNNSARDVAAIARTMALGELAYREGRAEEAFRLLREAVALEEKLAYDEPPGWMQPVRHALGALLLAEDRAAEAEEVYRADLRRHPHNAWSLLGLQQSLQRQRKTREADALAESVQRAWARADVKPPASCYCHPDARHSRADDPLAPWRGGVKTSQVLPEERHSIHTYYLASPESPDGRSVLCFVSADPRGETGEIRVVERATGKVRTLARDVSVEDAHRAACQQWISDGRRVVYHQPSAEDVWVVKCVDLESGETRVLARGRQLGIGQARHDVVPLYSPHWNPGEFRDLELLNAATGERRPTTLTADAVRAKYPDWTTERFGERPVSIFVPVLSPALDRVFFKLATPAGGDFRSRRASDRYGLVGYDLRRERFLFQQDDWGHPAWHPDGRRIINIGGRVTDSDGGRVERIANYPRLPGSHPSLSPDGRLFASDFYQSSDDGKSLSWGVGVGDARTGEFVSLRTFDNSRGARSWRPSHPHPVFSPDGRRLYFNVSADRWTRLHVAERVD